ncbi:sugar phosphate isomerase/epimerase [Candidatus Bathyarchaeota archaeon]|nr:MAG: sugar phosphate isomerase/epimerase [Candidatus Bathyarchaeota archaeon]
MVRTGGIHVKLKLGLIVSLRRDPKEEIEKVRRLGFPTCQVSCWNPDLYNEEMAKLLKQAAEENDVEITTLWTGFSGKAVWNFIDGPSTIGLVPPDTRKERLKTLKKASSFARKIGVESITTHVGFIPECPKDPVYVSLVEALKTVAQFCGENEQSFWFETGQETPITLLRTIEDVGTDNLGINLDPANLLMYGKANPVDALDIIGPYVRGVHAKDGEYPTNGRELGKEKPLGEGRVNFPALISKLKKLGYTGALTIEREITGPQQIRDIKKAKMFLEKLI